MTKIEALKTCVWLECFAMDYSPSQDEFTEAIRRLTEPQKYFSKLPNDEATL
jgi:hypothetical protein